MELVRDIETSRNNGYLAVRIVPTGRLGCFQQNLKVRKDGVVVEGDPRVWVFANEKPWIDSEGNERIRHHLRGFLAGTLEDGERFLRHCGLTGFEVEYAGFYVPLSRGEHTIVVGNPPHTDYPLREQLMVRSDQPPSLIQLTETVEREMGDIPSDSSPCAVQEPQKGE